MRHYVRDNNNKNKIITIYDVRFYVKTACQSFSKSLLLIFPWVLWETCNPLVLSFFDF
jgi:hypothetical protein